MAKCKDCTHYLTCRQGNSNPDYCGQFMHYKNTVEVVRCKDCVYYREGELLFVGVSCVGDSHANWYPDDFCSYGERRTDESNS